MIRSLMLPGKPRGALRASSNTHTYLGGCFVVLRPYVSSHKAMKLWSTEWDLNP